MNAPTVTLKKLDARVHALLRKSAEPLSAQAIAERLGVPTHDVELVLSHDRDIYDVTDRDGRMLYALAAGDAASPKGDFIEPASARAIGQRLAEVVRGEHLQPVFANLVGVSVTSLSNYERGVSMPPPALLITLAGLGWNINWLLTGEGSCKVKPELPAGVTPAMFPPRASTDIVGTLSDLIERTDALRLAGFARPGWREAETDLFRASLYLRDARHAFITAR